MNKKFFVAALSLLTLISIGSLRANAQSSCPNQEAFGVHTSLIADKNIQSQIEVTYFTTNDPNAFISEQAGLHRSASYVNLDAKQFVAQLKKLEGEVDSLRNLPLGNPLSPAADMRPAADDEDIL